MGRAYIHDPEGCVGGVGVTDVEGMEGVGREGIVADGLELIFVSHR